MIDEIKLVQVYYMPKEISEGILYYSEEFGVAAHLCACGCGNKVITPIEPVEWSFFEKNNLPSLHPSIGNWEIPCKSHYWIKDGRIEWSHGWSDAEIIRGRRNEERKREKYYNDKNRISNKWSWIINKIMKFFKGE